MRWLQIEVPGGLLSIEPRPPHCNRGRVYAKVQVTDPRFLHVSEQDSWPRYYFDPLTAVIECEEWLAAHGALDKSGDERPQWQLAWFTGDGSTESKTVDPVATGLIHGNSDFLTKMLEEL